MVFFGFGTIKMGDFNMDFEVSDSVKTVPAFFTSVGSNIVNYLHVRIEHIFVFVLFVTELADWGGAVFSELLGGSGKPGVFVTGGVS